MKAVISLIRLIYITVRRIVFWFEKHRVQVYASQAAFFIIISAVPMTIIAVALSGYFIPLSENYGRILQSFSSFDGVFDFEELIIEAKSKANISLLSVSAFTLLWSSSRGVRGIGRGIRNVYGGKKERRFIIYALKSLGLTLLYVNSLILALTVWVFGDTIMSLTFELSRSRLLKLINGSALFLLLSVVFTLTYRAFSGRRKGEVRELPGALFSAGGWLIFSALFEYYVEHFGKYSYVYGSIASLIVAMLWLYFCIEILLIGAGINVLLGKKEGK